MPDAAPRPQSMLLKNSRSDTSSGNRPRRFVGTGSANSSGAGTAWVISVPAMLCNAAQRQKVDLPAPAGAGT